MNESCQEIASLLSAYHDGELARDEARRVKAHVAGCADCTRALEAYSVHDSLLASAGPRRSEAEWEALADSVDAAIAAEEEAADAVAVRTPGKRWFGMPRPVFLGTAATLAVALVIAILQPELSQAPAPPPPVAPRADDKPAGSRDIAVGRRNADATPSDRPTKEEVAAAPPASAPVKPPPPPSVVPRAAEAGRGALLAEPDRATPAPATLAQATRRPAPDLSPLPPAGGAASLEEVRSAWVRLTAADSGPSEAEARGRASKSMRVLADGDAGDVRGRVSAERSPSVPDDLLAWARSERAAGRVDGARSALTLLTGDFPGNTAREAAWRELLSLDAEPAEGAPDAERALRTARSFDAFRAAYPERDEILGPRARAWLRAAQLDADGVCPAARVRADEWLDRARDDDRREALALRDTLSASCP